MYGQRGVVRRVGRLLVVVLAVSVMTAPTALAKGPRTSVRIDFGPRATKAPSGYTVDYGLPFTSGRGFGWEKASTGKAMSLVGNGVKRPPVHGRDHRYDTFLAMQAPHGPVRTAGQWQVALADGTYDVTVGVGDGAALDSVDRVVAQPRTTAAVVLIAGFRPTKAHRFATVTRRVVVSHGRLTLSPTGGRNTTLDFVVVDKAKPTQGTTPPVVKVSLAGTLLSPGSYAGSVVATASATDNAGGSGAASIRSSLDGAAAVPYTGPIVVATAGAHTLLVTAVDVAGRVGTATVSWTEHVPLSLVEDLTTGGTVGAGCAVTGFDGVLSDTAGDQCNPARISFGARGISLVSTAGQLADDNQQNALYKSFDASGGDFTVTARVVGPVDQLTADYQQVGVFFGPDQDNFVKVEAEHNGAPHLTMFYRENGAAGIVGTVALPALTTASTLDLTIVGHAGQLTVSYSLNGAAPVAVGSARTPVATAAWFSPAAKAGILVSNSGSSTAITGTFSRLSITGP